MAENISQRSDLVRVDDTLEISHQSASGAEIENLSEDVVPRASQQMCLTSFSLFLDSTGGNPRSKLHRSDQLLSYSDCPPRSATATVPCTSCRFGFWKRPYTDVSEPGNGELGE